MLGVKVRFFRFFSKHEGAFPFYGAISQFWVVFKEVAHQRCGSQILVILKYLRRIIFLFLQPRTL